VFWAQQYQNSPYSFLKLYPGKPLPGNVFLLSRVTGFSGSTGCACKNILRQSIFFIDLTG
jgi:hypothetical protein